MLAPIKIRLYHETGVVVPAGEPARCGGEPPGGGGAIRAPAGPGRARRALAQHHHPRARDVRARRRARAGRQLRARRRQAALHRAALQSRIEGLFSVCGEWGVIT